MVIDSKLLQAEFGPNGLVQMIEIRFLVWCCEAILKFLVIFFGFISRWKTLECCNELNMNLSDRVQSTEVWIEYFKNTRNMTLDKI